MTQYTIEVDGMRCGMCETHVNDAIRRAFPVKKVRSSHLKRQTVLVTEKPVDEQALKQAIEATGYTVGRIVSEAYEKKGLFSRLRHSRG